MNELDLVLQKNTNNFHSVVDFNQDTDKICSLDFTSGNKELTSEIINDTSRFSKYVDTKLAAANALYGIGGYKENRILYRRSDLFNAVLTGNLIEQVEVQDRSIHLGIDIWGTAGTKVYLPLGGMVHSYAFNDAFGDYGATIIVQHQLEGIAFHTLYGHVSLADLAQLQPGKYISRGEIIAHFGEPHENGNWPPHLHFQVIGDMNLKQGDFPGVCTKAESEAYFLNCPNPDYILNMLQFV
ncbi:hypothetical protein BH11BAC3_BH11BAC3_21510 [soil metagenome]